VPPALRRAQILERIQRDGGVSVADLARDHAVSAITVHRDLEQLAREGLVERFHGGARATGASTGRGLATIPTAWTQRVNQAYAEKVAIAEHAMRHIPPGATIFLDASTTALALARRLMHAPPAELTLVTNSPAIGCEFQHEAVHVVLTPGELDQHTRALTGRWTVEFLADVHFAASFVSAAGVSLEHGLTTSRRPLAEVVQAARARAERSVALIDATKFGRASLRSIARAQDLDVIVTDRTLPSEVADEYRAAAVALEIAAGDESI